MKQNIWFYLSIFLTLIVIIQGSTMLGLFQNSTIDFVEVSMEADSGNWGTGVTQNVEYIADAETAAKVGSLIIDCVCSEAGKAILPWEKSSWGVSVEYDPTLRLWRISKGYLLHRGAVVVLEQDTGKVISLLFQK